MNIFGADRNLVEVSPGELLFIRIDNKGEWPNTGTYQCVARNAVGRAISRNATVQKASEFNLATYWC